MPKKIVKISKSLTETAEIAGVFLNELKNKHKNNSALVVALSGDLGAGKTAFTKAVAKHLGVKNTVNSPTYVIMQKHAVKFPGYKFLFHLDAYRLKGEQELLNLGWEEIIADKNHIVFIEWPEIVKGAIPNYAHNIHLSTDEDGIRNIEFK